MHNLVGYAIFFLQWCFNLNYTNNKIIRWYYPTRVAHFRSNYRPLNVNPRIMLFISHLTLPTLPQRIVYLLHLIQFAVNQGFHTTFNPFSSMLLHFGFVLSWKVGSGDSPSPEAGYSFHLTLPRPSYSLSRSRVTLKCFIYSVDIFSHDLSPCCTSFNLLLSHISIVRSHTTSRNDHPVSR